MCSAAGRDVSWGNTEAPRGPAQASLDFVSIVTLLNAIYCLVRQDERPRRRGDGPRAAFVVLRVLREVGWVRRVRVRVRVRVRERACSPLLCCLHIAPRSAHTARFFSQHMLEMSELRRSDRKRTQTQFLEATQALQVRTQESEEKRAKNGPHRTAPHLQ
jgi:hypothetical protein